MSHDPRLVLSGRLQSRAWALHKPSTPVAPETTASLSGRHVAGFLAARLFYWPASLSVAGASPILCATCPPRRRGRTVSPMAATRCGAHSAAQRRRISRGRQAARRRHRCHPQGMLAVAERPPGILNACWLSSSARCASRGAPEQSRTPRRCGRQSKRRDAMFRPKRSTDETTLSKPPGASASPPSSSSSAAAPR